MPANDAQQSVVADGKHQTLGKTGSRASAKREGQVMDNMLEASGSSGIRRQYITKPLGEYLSPTEHGITREPPSSHEKPDAPS
ncbi:hypothetical protein N182_38375 [Sinorhizobium sp. GL2]|nr:hypothetical protein N182_38375 [Sinorhizobium sp. GL2]